MSQWWLETPVADGGTKEELGLLRECSAAFAIGGDPRPFSERYLWVYDRRGDAAPLRYTENQEYYWRETFGKITSYHDPMDWYLLKDRKAEYSTWILAVAFTGICCRPGFVCRSVSCDAAAHAETNRTLDLMWKRLPPYFTFRQGKWDSETKEIAHLDGRTSAVFLGLASSVNVGTGGTPKLVNKDEAGKYLPTFSSDSEASLMNSVPLESAWRSEAGTARGRDTLFAAHHRDIKAGRSATRYLTRFWWDNSKNALPRSYPFLRPIDAAQWAEKGVLTPGEAGGQIGEAAELALCARWGEGDWSERLAWRRFQIQEGAKAEHGDPTRGYQVFQREHLEDDVSCWQDLAALQFESAVMARALSEVREPIETRGLGNGLTLRVWERVRPGGRYAAGHDFAGPGHGHDHSALEIVEYSLGKSLVAELYGAGNEGMTAAVTAAIRDVLPLYTLPGHPLPIYGPEIQGVGQEAVLLAGGRLGYQNVWRRGLRPGDKIDSKAYQTRISGWSNDASTHDAMLTRLQEQFNSGSWRIPSRDLLDEMASYDPKAVRPHYGDRMTGFMIALGIIPELYLTGERLARSEPGIIPVVYHDFEQKDRGKREKATAIPVRYH